MNLTKKQFNAAVMFGVLCGTVLIAWIIAIGWFAKHHPLYFWAFVCAGCVCALIVKAVDAFNDFDIWRIRRKRERIFTRNNPLFHLHTEDLNHD